MSDGEDQLSACKTLTDADDAATPSGAAALTAGTHVGRYMVVGRIGEGGMGVVYKAFDPDLNRPVALKLLTLKRATNQDSEGFLVDKARLLREAQALAQLAHPNVITVFDVGVFQTPAHQDGLQGEAVFMAMEFVEGKDLRTVLEENKLRSPPSEAFCTREELLEILKAAGRGLSAAHKVGIVHRDFKPANVIIGGDGRVRVLDFGLARSAPMEASVGPDAERGHEKAEAEPCSKTELSGRFAALGKIDSSGSLLKYALTQAGSIVGTPHYMAPEQHLNETADEKSDQYAFCVVLFEALYGVRPFSGRSLREMIKQITLGDIRRPEGVEVPGWLDRIAVRGLSVDPAERYPSMDLLLADLADDPAITRARRKARRLKLMLIGFAALFAVLGALGLWVGLTQGARLCAGAEERLQGVWDDGMRLRVQEAFTATGRPYALDTFERVDRRLARIATAWVAAHTEACRATHVRGSQSGQLLDLRMGCLERRLSELRALVELFAAKPDPEVLDKAVQAVPEPASLQGCADARALLAKIPPPRDAGTAARVRTLREELARADALRKAGKYPQALARTRELLPAARKTAYPPLEAEVTFLVGSLEEYASELEASARDLTEASYLADSIGDDGLRLDAYNEMICLLGDRLNRFDALEPFVRMGQAVLAHLGEDGSRKAQWHYCVGLSFGARGRYDQALPHYADALGIRERIGGAGSLEAGKIRNTMGNAYWRMGDNANALEQYTRALRIAEQNLGPEHPEVGYMLNGLGNLTWSQGGYEQAQGYFARALAIWERALGTDNQLVAKAHNNLGNVALSLGELDQALAHYTLALRIGEKIVGPEHQDTGARLNNIGLIFLNREDYRQAGDYFERARAIFEKTLGPGHATVAMALNNLADVALLEGRLDQALTLYTLAARKWEKALGPAYRSLSLPQCGLGWALLGKGRAREAIAHFERVLEICGHAEDGKNCQGDELEPYSLAEFGLARALWQTADGAARTAGTNRQRAIQLARQAIAHFKALHSTRIKRLRVEAEAWLEGRDR